MAKLPEPTPVVEEAPPPEKYTVIAVCHLLEPYQFIRFEPRIPVEVYEITPWMKMQVAAGLMKIT